MHVGIDGGCWTNQRGYGRFLRELLSALGQASLAHRYTVYLDPSSYDAFDIGPPFERKLVRTAQAVGEAATAEGSRSIPDVLRMTLGVREDLDLFFFPSVYSYFPLLRPIPVLLGIHDTIADRNPKFSFQTRRQEFLWRVKVRLAIAQATTILTVSEYSKRSIAEWFRIPHDRIAVIQEASAARFRVQEYPEPPRPFALYVGGISPNKNLARLLQAFAKTRARETGAQLLLVGDYERDGFKSNYAELTGWVERLNLGGQAIFKGFVPDHELQRLYNTCTVFTMPSLDEGFGLPAIEAMSCGRPTIVSSGNSLEEVVGSAGVIVNPASVDDIAAAIDRIFEDDRLRADLGRRALERARQFSWETAAQQLLGAFAQAAAHRR